MRKAFLCILSFILVIAVFLPVGCAETEVTIKFFNNSDITISEFYIAPEDEHTIFGKYRNNKRIKPGESDELHFTAEELASETLWWVRLGLVSPTRTAYKNWHNFDFSDIIESGIINFVNVEGTSTYAILAGKKNFFHLTNITSFNIVSLHLFPSGSESDLNRLEKPFLPGEALQIRMDSEEVMQNTTWDLRIGVEEGAGTTYYTLENFPIENLTGCECVILKPFKNTISFSYSNDPVKNDPLTN